MSRAVFVPAVMSVGLLFSIASLLRDVFRWGSHRSLERRVATESVAVAATTLAPGRPVDAVAPSRTPRLAYLLWTIVLLAVACYVAVGATANYLRAGGYVSDIAWLLALSLGLAATIGFLAAMVAMAFVSWPREPSWASGTLRRMPFLGGADFSEGHPSAALGVAIWVVAGTVVLLALVVGSTDVLISRLDEPMADWLVGHDGLAALRHLDPLGRTEVALPLAALAGLAALRCRILAVSYLLAVVAGGSASLVLKAVIERPRPATSTLVGADSFPSGHVIQAVLIAGLLPLALAVLTNRRRIVAPATVVLGIGAVGAAAERIRAGEHWPTDVLGGALIGVTLVLVVRWVVEHRHWHGHCRACVWSVGPHGLRHRRGAFALSLRTASRIELVGRVWSLAAVVALLVLLGTVGLPASDEPEGLIAEVAGPLQLGLLALFGVGAVVALRFDAVGAVVIALAGAGLGTLAAIEYPTWAALLVTVTFLVPPFLLWLVWQRRHRWRTINVLAVVTGALLMSSWAGATGIYDHFFGPTHPLSEAEAVAVDTVRWAWSGAVTSTSATVVARVDHGGLARLVTVDESGVRRTSTPVSPDDDGIVRLGVSGLAPGRDHDWVIEVDGRADEGRGRGGFGTPATGAMSLRIAVGACARTGSNGAVFDEILAQRPDLFLQLGDIHYRNIDTASPGRFRAAYDDLLTRPGQAALYREVPVAYVWDDHDFGGNDADSSSPSASAAQQVYRQVVPHHPLPGGGDGAVHRAFSLGRVRIVITDTRSARTDETMLGSDQLDWFVDEVTTASADHALVIWASPTPWIGTARQGADTWAGWAAERERIATTLADAGVDNLVMVAGDAHMVAIDDGTNSDYAPDGEAGFPVLHAAALDRPGSVKGGPYSEGTFPGGGQFGLVDIDDDGGDHITVTLRGLDWQGDELVRLERTFEVAPS